MKRVKFHFITVFLLVRNLPVSAVLLQCRQHSFYAQEVDQFHHPKDWVEYSFFRHIFCNRHKNEVYHLTLEKSMRASIFMCASKFFVLASCSFLLSQTFSSSIRMASSRGVVHYCWGVRCHSLQNVCNPSGHPTSLTLLTTSTRIRFVVRVQLLLLYSSWQIKMPRWRRGCDALYVLSGFHRRMSYCLFIWWLLSFKAVNGFNTKIIDFFWGFGQRIFLITIDDC